MVEGGGLESRCGCKSTEGSNPSLSVNFVNKINGERMTTVTISTKYQVVIPKEIRDKIQITPGQKFQMIQIGNRIELIPIKNIKEARGFLKGMDTTIEREADRL